MSTTAKKPASMARLTIVLFVITAVTALLLGLVNYITADKIALINDEKTKSAMNAVVSGAESFPDIGYTGEDAIVSGCYSAVDSTGAVIGYVVQVAPSGFGGAIDMVVGVSPDGVVTGVSIISMKETSGLGDNAKNENWRAQFIGSSGEVAVTKDGGEIDALTGATITSRAISNGVNSALDAWASIAG